MTPLIQAFLMLQLASKKSDPGGQRVRCPKATRELIRTKRWATWGTAPLGDAVRPGGKLVALPTGTLIRHDVPPRHVPSLSTRGCQRPQARGRCALVREVARSTTAPCRARVFSPLSKLLASPGDGGGMARRTGARQLVRARDSANDI